MAAVMHKQNLKRVWRVRAPMRRAARQRLNDPEWCRRAEERLRKEFAAWDAASDEALNTTAGAYADPITRDWSGPAEDTAWADL